jgi:hypothetical protein
LSGVNSKGENNSPKEGVAMKSLTPKRTVGGLLATASMVAFAAPAAGMSPAEQSWHFSADQPTPATPRSVPNGVTSGLYCGRNYSMNPDGGRYCIRLRSVVPSPPLKHVSNSGFSASDAEAGAGAALVLVLAVAGSTIVVRRRRGTSRPRAPRTPATT